jgi:DNA-binding transcriptional ArsR family regulator/uncharacterized protein YndB with AHSA1/START domain
MESDDRLFRALASPARRQLLDRLKDRNGQTLGQLCEGLEMARQSTTQHLDVLVGANLVTTVRRGRERMHYLNPVPIHELQERWIGTFERPALDALRAVRRRAEEEAMPTIPTYVYVTYVQSTPERVWHALTDEELSGAYWGHRNVSTWEPGAPWEHVRVDGSGVVDVVGTVVVADAPRRLVVTFESPQDRTHPTTVTFDIEPYRDIVKLTVAHEGLERREDLEAIGLGWPAVLANLKSLLETGHVMAQAPWEMHASVRAEQMARADG